MFASPAAMSAWIAEHGSYVVESSPTLLTRFRVLLHSIADGDFNPAHCQPHFAKYSIFKGMVSHGIGTLSRAEGPFLELFQFERPLETIATAICAKYTKPLFCGDTYRYIYTVRSLRQNKLKWHARVRVVCMATSGNQPERTVAVWNWRPVFVEKPDVPEKELETLRMGSYKENLFKALVPKPIRIAGTCAAYSCAVLFWLALFAPLALNLFGRTSPAWDQAAQAPPL